METVHANRLKIWQALSEFFLDTEITDSTFDYVARVVLETGYSPQEIHNILWGEVFPALEGNLKSIAGEWAGWTDEWLLEHLSVCEASTNKLGNAALLKKSVDAGGKWQSGFRRSTPETRFQSNALDGFWLVSAIYGHLCYMSHSSHRKRLWLVIWLTVVIQVAALKSTT